MLRQRWERKEKQQRGTGRNETRRWMFCCRVRGLSHDAAACAAPASQLLLPPPPPLLLLLLLLLITAPATAAAAAALALLETPRCHYAHAYPCQAVR